MQEALFEVGEPDSAPSTLVYVIGAEGSSVVKIGVTADIAKRLVFIQTGNPERLVVRWKTPGDRRLEKQLHVRFESLRLEGEWFDFGNQDPVLAVQTAINGSSGPEAQRAGGRSPHPLDRHRSHPRYDPNMWCCCPPTPAELATYKDYAIAGRWCCCGTDHDLI